MDACESTRIVEHDVSWIFFFFLFSFFLFSFSFSLLEGSFLGWNDVYHATGCDIYNDTARGTHEGGAAAADSRMLHWETSLDARDAWPSCAMDGYAARLHGAVAIGETCGPSNRGRLLQAGFPPRYLVHSCTPPSGFSAERVRVGSLGS